jgi:hypothetical protein
MVKLQYRKFRTKGKHFCHEKNVRTCCDANSVDHGDWKNYKKIGVKNGRTPSNGLCNRNSK